MEDFLAVLGDMRNGDVLVDCSAKLTELLAAIEATGGKGKMTLGKLTIWYELVRANKVLDAEFQRACDAISEGSKTEVLMGGLL